MPQAPAISVVVMAIHGDARVREAIASLADPALAIEIIVVNTGTGSVAGLLDSMLEELVVVESPALRLPGGTRNLGLAEARAPIVAFLAADCLATPGWAARRIKAHEHAEAVASAILPAPASNGGVHHSSLAIHMLMYCRRDPDRPPERTVRYGVSYRREVFDRLGIFSEDRIVGEDTEFNERLQALPAWEPGIVTLHHNPPGLAAGLADSWRRGVRLQHWMRTQTPRPTARTLHWTVGAIVDAMSLLKHARPERRGSLLAAAPLVWCLGLARMGGALSQWRLKIPPTAG